MLTPTLCSIFFFDNLFSTGEVTLLVDDRDVNFDNEFVFPKDLNSSLSDDTVVLWSPSGTLGARGGSLSMSTSIVTAAGWFKDGSTCTSGTVRSSSLEEALPAWPLDLEVPLAGS